jgi:nucleotide-binding universal stress UspA family protein
MLKPSVILAPTDFSDPSRDAIATAAEFASRFGATLILAHVVQAIPKLPASVSIFKEADYERSLHQEASRQMAELCAPYAKAGMSVQSEVGTANDVGMELLRIGAHRAADMIVIATHGMTGWRELAFGSVTEKVVRMAPCAVLVLRASRPAAARA